MATLINNNNKLPTKLTREFTMEIVLALEFLQKKNVIHRDLKPQNILLDDTYHIKLADFGAAKIIDPEEIEKEINDKNLSDSESDDCLKSSDDESIDGGMDDVTIDEETNNVMEKCIVTTQIGSLLYISPEMLKFQIATFGSDLWALGCIIYQCLTGTPPFLGKNKFEVESKIKDCEFKFPKDMEREAKDLIAKLLKPNPLERLGAGKEGSKNSMQQLKIHPFFKKECFKKCKFRIPSVDTLKKVSSDSLISLFGSTKINTPRMEEREIELDLSDSLISSEDGSKSPKMSNASSKNSKKIKLTNMAKSLQKVRSNAQRKPSNLKLKASSTFAKKGIKKKAEIVSPC